MKGAVIIVAVGVLGATVGTVLGWGWWPDLTVVASCLLLRRGGELSIAAGALVLGTFLGGLGASPGPSMGMCMLGAVGATAWLDSRVRWPWPWGPAFRAALVLVGRDTLMLLWTGTPLGPLLLRLGTTAIVGVVAERVVAQHADRAPGVLVWS